jgi:hypothetical protein
MAPFTKVLQGLNTFPNKLEKNSRVDDPFNSLMEHWFGK